jgi:hypothetical protein
MTTNKPKRRQRPVTFAAIERALTTNHLPPFSARAIVERIRQLQRFKRNPYKHWQERNPFRSVFLCDETGLRAAAKEVGYTPAQLVQIRNTAFREWLNGDRWYEGELPIRMLADRIQRGDYHYLFN